MSEPTDTERLDWLEREEDATMPVQDPKDNRWWIFYGDDSQTVTGDTMRAAIDAAMLAEREKTA